MSLVAWFPLNGNLNNYGCSDYTLTNSNATVSTDGKIGKCYSFNGTNSFLTSNFSYQNFGNNVSIAFWVKILEVTSENQLLWGRYQNGPFIDIQDTRFIRCYLWAKNADGTIGTAKSFTCEYTSYINKWTHVAFTFDGITAKLYLNGELKTSANWNCNVFYSSGACQIGQWNNQGRWLKGLANDFRIYNHCLSLKEVHEISKGLVVHYKLDSEYQTGNLNFYSGANSKGSSEGGSSSFTITKLENEDGYNYKLTHTGTGSNAWKSIDFPTIPRTKFIPGKRYFWSFKVRINKCTGDYVQYRRAIAGNDYLHTSTSVVTTSLPKNVWTEYNSSQIMSEGMTIASDTYYYLTETAYNASTQAKKYYMSPRMEFYTGGVATKDFKYEFDFDVKDVQIIEADEFPGYIDNTFASDYVVDNSGFLNNASTNGSLQIANDSPVYEKSLKFADSSYLKFKLPPMDIVTYSFWVKPNAGSGGYGSITHVFNDPSSTSKSPWLAVNTESSKLWFYKTGGTGGGQNNYHKVSGTLTNDVWYHAVFVWNKGNTTWYLNGEKQSTTTNWNGQSFTNSSDVSIGDSYTGTNWATQFLGQLSDFRIYATALTDADVEELYKVGASIDNRGNTFTNQFVEDSSIANVKINKNKQIYVKELQEENLTGTAKTKIYKNDKLIKTIQFIEH